MGALTHKGNTPSGGRWQKKDSTGEDGPRATAAYAEQPGRRESNTNKLPAAAAAAAQLPAEGMRPPVPPKKKQADLGDTWACTTQAPTLCYLSCIYLLYTRMLADWSSSELNTLCMCARQRDS
jgi:hypothetical protein